MKKGNIISESQIRDIISEETKRFKKKLTLESEKKQLLKKLNEMYMEEKMLDEEETLNEWGEHKKAERDFRATYKTEIDAIDKAYKDHDMSYVDLSKAMIPIVSNETTKLAKKYGLSGSSDLGALQTSLKKMIQPMDYATFQRQAEKGVSLGDIGAGATGGRSKITGQQ